MPSTYVALFTTAPTDAGGGTEVSGGGYARVATAGVWAAASGTSISNSAVITFGAPTANWGVVTHVGIYDAATAGNLLGSGALTAAKTINNGDAAPSFAAGALSMTLD